MIERSLLRLYALTLLCGSMLVFCIQPMLAKHILPLLGGAPSVWTVSQVFFQILLLAGYLYAHALNAFMPLKRQIVVHVAVLLSGVVWLIVLMAFPPSSIPPAGNPVLWQLIYLLRVIGLPFFALSAGGSLLQCWFSYTYHRAAADPFFLYAASNLGSLVGLLIYPVLLEPGLTLAGQKLIWIAGYLILVALVGACAIVCSRCMPARTMATELATNEPPPSRARKLGWIGLAFFPCSLMLSVTAYQTADIASIPLLWVLPLSLYLLSFVFAFGRRQLHFDFILRVQLMAALFMVFIWLVEIHNPVWLVLVISLFGFFMSVLALHCRLALDRPDRRYLTSYYLCLASGGAFGGVFTMWLAPLLFSGAEELPLLLIVACAAAAYATIHNLKKRDIGRDALVALGIGAVMASLGIGLQLFFARTFQVWALVLYGIPLILSYLTVKRPLRFVLTLAVIVLGGHFLFHGEGVVRYRQRNYFGTIKITYDPKGPFYNFYHGTTLHGMEFIAANRRHEPLAYYHRLGPAGQIMALYNQQRSNPRVAIIGLGIGAMLSYAQPDEEWTVYEIDPAIVHIAAQSPWFFHWRETRAKICRAVIGDARINLQHAVAGEYGLIVLDAFSSDSVPVHLLTREALALYLSRLAEGGILAANISSWNLNLTKVISNLAADAGLICLNRLDDHIDSDAEATLGKYPSNWVVLARRLQDIARLARDSRWRLISSKSNAQPWTDDYSNILGVVNWF